MALKNLDVDSIGTSKEEWSLIGSRRDNGKVNRTGIMAGQRLTRLDMSRKEVIKL